MKDKSSLYGFNQVECTFVMFVRANQIMSAPIQYGFNQVECMFVILLGPIRPCVLLEYDPYGSMIYPI